MDWKEKRDESRKLFAQVKELVDKPDKTAEEEKQVETLLTEAQRLKAEAMQYKEIMDAAAEMEGLGATEEKGEEGEGDKPETKDGKGPGEFKMQGREAKGSRFDDPGEFLYACYMAYIGQVKDERLAFFHEEPDGGHEKKQMVESVGASGGFLVPTEYLAQLQAVGPEDAIVRPRATIIRMRRRAIDIPVLDQTGTTANRPHWFGGMIFYWAEEATEKTITTASFRKVTLTAHKLIGYTRASDELLDDAAISLNDFLSGPLGFAGGVNWNEDYTFLRGTGAGQPLGVINAGATITVNRQSATANPVQYTDLVNMLESFLPSARGMWVINQSAMSNLLLMMDQAGGAANTGTYIWGSAADGVPNRLLGLPVTFTEKTPTVGNAGDVLLADWRYYLIGDRQATTVESTKFDRWSYDQTSWRVVHRVDGQPWLSAPLTFQDGTIQVSPFVILGAKST